MVSISGIKLTRISSLDAAVGRGVAVGGIGVAVGGNGVAVEGIGVAVGGIDVSVGDWVGAAGAAVQADANIVNKQTTRTIAWCVRLCFDGFPRGEKPCAGIISSLRSPGWPYARAT